MRNRFARLRKDERGMSLMFVGVGFMTFVAASTLAIDVGMFMTAKSQAQNSADSGALAGAIALVYNDWNNRTSTGPAVENTVANALANPVLGTNVSVGPGDVTFPADPAGEFDRVHVTVYRTSSRGNAVPTLIGPIFGYPTVNIWAEATAEATPASAVTCVKPFTIPDKWDERNQGTWDPDDTFEMYDNHNNLLANPDYYNGDLDSPGYTGYNPVRDRGLELTLRAGTGNNIEPTMYYSWKMPGDIGADFYQNNISGCNTYLLQVGDHPEITQEPGNMEGPTVKGVQDLLDQDPGAVWDDGCSCVKGSAFNVSPRIFPIPVYDPVYYEDGKINGRNASLKIANVIGFFVTRRDGNNIYGRITPIAGVAGNGSGPKGSFARAIRLVE
jgi:Flp pilus assembly protein TadG